VTAVLGHHWEPAEATVIARNPRAQAAGYEPNYDFVLDVRPSTGPPLRVTIHEGFTAPAGGFRSPSVGDVVGVLYDPKSQHVKFDNSDPRLSAAPAGQAVAGGFAAIAAAPPGTSPSRAGSPDASELAGTVQSFSGEAATEMLGALLGSGGADAVADMKARAAGNPAERLAKLEALRDNGVLTEAEYEAQRQKIIEAI
jgi:hypothetical protein